MITIARLPIELWPMVEPVMSEMGNAMPDNPKRDTFVAALDGDKLAAVMHVEVVFHFDFVKTMPGYENQGLAPKVVAAAVACLPRGFAGIWLADRDEKDDLRLLAQSLGARDVGLYRYYRKDGGPKAQEVTP